MSDSTELDNDIYDFELGTGYGMLCKNRPINSRGYSTGGVSIAYRKSHIDFKEIVLPGNTHEILIAEGSMPNFTRKLVAICVYMPPGLSSSSAQVCLGFLVDAVLEIKRKYRDPFITICLLYTSPSPRD